MTDRDPSSSSNPANLAKLFGPESRLVPRLHAVARFDPGIYAELEEDAAALPQAVAVVIAASVLAGLGQGSLPGLFLGVAGAILLWSTMTALIWGVCWLVIGPGNYARLLRGTGFAWAWLGLLLFSGLPWVGWIFAWGGLLTSVASAALATRAFLDLPLSRAGAICAAALGLPLLLAWLLAR